MRKPSFWPSEPESSREAGEAFLRGTRMFDELLSAAVADDEAISQRLGHASRRTRMAPEVLAFLWTLGEATSREAFERALPSEAAFTHDEAWPTLVPGWSLWGAVAAALEHEDLLRLMRGLTFAEGAPLKWFGGSASGGIALFEVYGERFPEDASALAEWVLAHRSNPWLPYGRSVPESVVSTDAYTGWQRARVRAKASNLAREAHRSQEGQTERARQATKNLFGAARRGDVKALEALLAKGADRQARDDSGRTAVEIARAEGRVRAAEILAEWTGPPASAGPNRHTGPAPEDWLTRERRRLRG